MEKTFLSVVHQSHPTTFQSITGGDPVAKVMEYKAQKQVDSKADELLRE